MATLLVGMGQRRSFDKNRPALGWVSASDDRAIDVAQAITFTSFATYGVSISNLEQGDFGLDSLISTSIAGAVAFRQGGVDFPTYRARLKEIAKAYEINGVLAPDLSYNPFYFSEEKYMAIPHVGPLISAKE